VVHAPGEAELGEAELFSSKQQQLAKPLPAAAAASAALLLALPAYFLL